MLRGLGSTTCSIVLNIKLKRWLEGSDNLPAKWKEIYEHNENSPPMGKKIVNNKKKGREEIPMYQKFNPQHADAFAQHQHGSMATPLYHYYSTPHEIQPRLPSHLTADPPSTQEYQVLRREESDWGDTDDGQWQSKISRD